MGHPYLFLAVGIVAAATALIVWLNSEGPQPVRTGRSRSPARRRPYFRPELDKECMICCENAVNTRFKPCQHGCMCEKCVETYMRIQEAEGYAKRCPYCRGNIQSYEKF